MDRARIEEIIGIAEQWDLDALEVQDEQGLVRVVRRSAAQVAAPAAATATPAPADAGRNPRSGGIPAGLHPVTSPMVGIFLAAAPENGQVLAVRGDTVRAGQALGYVEAMKMRTEVASDIDGELVEIMAADMQAVQFGAPLFLVRPATLE